MTEFTQPVLKVEHLTKYFGGLAAVDDVSFELYKNDILGIIGPNGAGKTTVFNLITGFIKPTSGKVTYQDQDITNFPSEKIAQLGMARTFQNIRAFKSMSVLENVMVAGQLHNHAQLLPTLLSFPKFLSSEIGIKNTSEKFIDLLGLTDVMNTQAGSLSHGMQRRLEIARALALSPTILLLDEPAAGLNPTETSELLNLIYRIREEYGVSVILVEHDMGLVMNLCEKLVVLNYGKVIAQGTCQEVRKNESVIEAYLGAEYST